MLKRFVKTRTELLAAIILIVMAIFVLRLFQLQVIDHGEYVNLAKSTQQRSDVISATRGEIYMMDGRRTAPVVLNRSVFDIVADPQVVKESQRAEIVASIQELAAGEASDDVAGLLEKDNSRYEVLARGLTRNQAEKLKEKKFSGVMYKSTSVRSYPEGQLGAHVLGFVNNEGDGQYGVEGGLNDRLKGKDGLLRSVADISNVPLMIGKDSIRREPEPGENLALSIDRNIQSFTEEALKAGVGKAGATEGSVIVMNPKNGQILAMANYPTYNPENFYKITDASVFNNYATMVPYEPASVIKAFMMGAGIDKGVINAGTTYNNTDCIKVVDRTMCNAFRGYPGTTTMQQVLNNSYNVGTINIGRRFGNGERINYQARKTMYEYYHDRFGLGKKTGIEVGEAGGYIFPPDSAEGNEVRYSAMTYGQSLDLTMIQVTAGFASLVNGGKYYQPTVLAGEIDDFGNLKRKKYEPLRQAISESASAQTREMLRLARKSAWVGDNDPAGYEVGGKTGTAETVVDGKYTKSETVGTYIGYGGANEPEYVIMVRVAAPGRGMNLEGGVHASPIFADISNKMIKYLKLPPRG